VKVVGYEAEGMDLSGGFVEAVNHCREELQVVVVILENTLLVVTTAHNVVDQLLHFGHASFGP
jgi:hypothetical protein